MAAGNAFGARLVEGNALVHACCHGRVDADVRHDAIHKLCLTKNPVEHRPAKTKIAHLAPPLASAAAAMLVAVRRQPFDPGQSNSTTACGFLKQFGGAREHGCRSPSRGLVGHRSVYASSPRTGSLPLSSRICSMSMPGWWCRGKLPSNCDPQTAGEHDVQAHSNCDGRIGVS